MLREALSTDQHQRHNCTLTLAASLPPPPRYTQQHLLEMESTLERLAQEKEVLGATMKFYSAATALEGVFKSDGEGSEPGPQPPAGGPD